MKFNSVLLVLILVSPIAWSHKSSDSFINLTVANDHITGRWDIALRDLEYALALDADADGAITWAELRERYQDIENYAFSRLQVNTRLPVNNTGECVRLIGQLQVDHHSDGAYAVINFNLQCSSPIDQLVVAYQLLFDLDPTHRGLVQISNDDNTEFVVLSPDNQQAEIDFSVSNQWQTFRQFLTEGVWHIWMGYDHILFLLCLLLPTVVRKTPTGWVQNDRFNNTLWQVGKIVTAFTIAHSITLVLGVLQVVSLPSRLVESAIAFSVILVAVNNLYAFFSERAWFVAFGFGLIHGFGFASVLSGLGLSTANLGTALLSFNLGVELGQLAIVSVFLPVAYYFRSYWFYKRVVLHAGSHAIILLAMGWFLQRAFDVSVFNAWG
ncbi:MAG: HupE/UreJ family protein [Methylococcales bacterium]